MIVMSSGHRLCLIPALGQFQVSLFPHVRADADGMARTIKPKQRLLGDSSCWGLASGEHGVRVTEERGKMGRREKEMRRESGKGEEREGGRGWEGRKWKGRGGWEEVGK